MNIEANDLKHRAVLVLPHIRVQNANAISSPLTWGFPAITAFTGLMIALERRLSRDAGIALYGIGVICHHFEAQVTTEGYTRTFRRNPLLPDGSSAAIVEEGRVHLELTLVFYVQLVDAQRGEVERAALAKRIAHELAGMRVAGGSVIPPLPGTSQRSIRPILELVPDLDNTDETQIKNYQKWWRRLIWRLLPGFALVSRDDVLKTRLAELQVNDSKVSELDAWLDLSRLNINCQKGGSEGIDSLETVEWIIDKRVGWLVPIPVGFAALSDLHLPGTVNGARDMKTPFRFVETVYSVGQWISPNRLKNLDDLVWVTDHDPDHPTEYDLYRCCNAYRPLPNR
ncbi:type I-F CRISPR-associated protein Csy2 [Chromatium okenii]|uniref:type I-F CRISPR-associated protein Csy2 n=1 Tax=Chromatium okenii TaxID=61644 RepID=UPI0026EB5745|nr:type I-F CRISPR-associated protein Csy2 [Chromatium okenii]MBV5311520.1 type I-F CRISPR-associated protein Csy2 [Chromatium okenii]